MEPFDLVMLAGGLVVLSFGADLLVRGAAGLAARMGISALVIGLTVVAYGTSAPEMAVSVHAAWNGQADVALGNVVGSNIFNVLMILGLSSLPAALVVARQLLRFDMPLMIGVSAVTWLLAADGVVSRTEGVLFVVLAVVYTVHVIRLGRKAGAGETAAVVARGGLGWHVVLVVVGLVLLVVGARWFVNGAMGVARALDVSELVISLTIVAAGTSLPEVATSVVASIRGERDIAVGNVVGSNIFNLLAVLGASAAIGPDGVRVAPAALRLDVPVMVASAAACWVVARTGFQISRSEGSLFVLAYCGYVAVLVANS